MPVEIKLRLSDMASVCTNTRTVSYSIGENIFYAFLVKTCRSNPLNRGRKWCYLWNHCRKCFIFFFWLYCEVALRSAGRVGGGKGWRECSLSVELAIIRISIWTCHALCKTVIFTQFEKWIQTRFLWISKPINLCHLQRVFI